MTARAAAWILLSLAGCRAEAHCDALSGAACLGPEANADRAGADAGSAASDAGRAKPDAAANLIPASFTRLTIRSTGGWFTGDRNGECNGSYISTYTVEATSRELSWDYCGRRGQVYGVFQGHRTLTPAEFQAVQNVVSYVGPSQMMGCGVDKTRLTLEVQAAGRVFSYGDEFYSCNCSECQSSFVYGIDGITSWLILLARNESARADVEARGVREQDIDVIEAWTDPPSYPPPVPGSTCELESGSDYRIDLATRTFDWEYCGARPGSDGYVVVKDARQLSEDEIASLLSAYGELEFGASQPCELLLARSSDHTSHVTVTAQDSSSHSLSDEVASCSSGWTGSDYTVGLEDFVELVTALRR